MKDVSSENHNSILLDTLELGGRGAEHDAYTCGSTNEAGHPSIQEEAFALLTRITTVKATVSEAWFGTGGSICLNVRTYENGTNKQVVTTFYYIDSSALIYFPLNVSV